ncbi:hypothetical protein [Lactococcus garvieae]|nr:hypothetical protein [Lactococcus garvieae]
MKKVAIIGMIVYMWNIAECLFSEQRHSYYKRKYYTESNTKYETKY